MIRLLSYKNRNGVSEVLSDNISSFNSALPRLKSGSPVILKIKIIKILVLPARVGDDPESNTHPAKLYNVQTPQIVWAILRRGA
jgi:hypothetical protein